MSKPTTYQPPKNKKPVQLVKNLDKVPAKKRDALFNNAVMQIKYDGVFAYGIVNKNDNHNSFIYSRTGKLCTSLNHIQDHLLNLSFQIAEPCVLIFEVMGPMGMALNDISGNFRRENVQFDGAHIVLHDLIRYDHFVEGISDVDYLNRYTALSFYYNGAEHLNDYDLHLAQGLDVRDEAHAQAFAAKVIESGGEGVVVKDQLATWKAGSRTEGITKIKQELSFDLLVYGVERGDPNGKYAETCGTIKVLFKHFGKADGERMFISISGMTDAQRDAWWNDPSLIVGKIVKVDAMTYSAHGSLREPRFKEIREDKLEADL